MPFSLCPGVAGPPQIVWQCMVKYSSAQIYMNAAVLCITASYRDKQSSSPRGAYLYISEVGESSSRALAYVNVKHLLAISEKGLRVCFVYATGQSGGGTGVRA